MKIYMPPQKRETLAERREIHNHVRSFLKDKGFDVISRTGGGRSLPWLRRAGALVLETNVVTEADEAECLYIAEDLGHQALILFDAYNSSPGNGPSDRLVTASRRDGNENSNLWLVRHTPITENRFAIIDVALKVFARVDLPSD